MRKLLLFLAVIGTAVCQSTFKPARPPAIPLANRNPYLAAHLPAGSNTTNSGYLAGTWPVFWSYPFQPLGWAGLIRVDGTTYVWMGKPALGTAQVTQVSFEYTSTRSIFTMNVGGAVKMVIEFMSPVTPNDMKRASFPVSYLNVVVSSLDGKSHKVQVYSDISAEWIAGDRSAIAQWDYGVTGNVAYHHVFRQKETLFSESVGQTDYGDWYYASGNVAGLTHRSGVDRTVRTQFINTGVLDNTQDTNYRAINSQYPVFAFSRDLGTIASTTTGSMRTTINLAQDPVILFEEPGPTNVSLPGLWKSYFSTNLDAILFFYNDFATVRGLCTALDNQISSDSIAAAGLNYATITTLAVRQAFAGLQFANTTDTPYLFLKEISSDGNIQTVDVIFPFHPIVMYLNPTLLKFMLDPLFYNQENGLWKADYAIHDLGSHYPLAVGHPDVSTAEMQPLEECGNMIIMTLAYAQRTNDVAYLRQHYPILKQWNDYLINDSLYPGNQKSTDDFAGQLGNQTNLALKGMIGIQAMSQIAQKVGNTADAQNFSSIAQRYISQWQSLGIAKSATPPHSTLAYFMNATYGLLYNLYADRELGLGLVPQAVYDMQSTFYPTVSGKYGVPLDTRHSYTKADWMMFCAAIASNSTRDMFTSKLALWIDQTSANKMFPDLYDVNTGDARGFTNRPVVGAMFAQLALNSAPG